MAAPSPAQRFALFGVCALLAAAVVGAAGGRTSGVGVLAAPQRVVQGNTVTLSVAVRPAGTRCSISVSYPDGSRQKGLSARRAVGGRITWRWRVSRFTRPGRAVVSVSCGTAGSVTRTITVIGSVVAVKIKVAKTGFTVRPLPFGGTRVSYGVLLENLSKTENAVRTSVLVNFVMADNRLIGSASSTIGEIRAGMTHAVGGELQFLGAAPVVRLEVTVQVGERARPTRQAPAPGSVRLVGDLFEPAFVGSVEGELHNDDRRTLEFARLSAVILDAQGNVIGGASGFAGSSMPPGARQFFKLTCPPAVPLGNAASAIVSVEPTYRA